MFVNLIWISLWLSFKGVDFIKEHEMYQKISLMINVKYTRRIHYILYFKVPANMTKSQNMFWFYQDFLLK